MRGNVAGPVKRTVNRFCCRNLQATGQLVLEILHAAKVMPIGVFQPTHYNRLVAFVVGMLQIMKSDQQPDRLGRTTVVRAVRRTERRLENRPVDLPGELVKRVIVAEDVDQATA